MWHFTAPLWQPRKAVCIVTEGKAEGTGLLTLVGVMVLEEGSMHFREISVHWAGLLFGAGPMFGEGFRQCPYALASVYVLRRRICVLVFL